MFTCSHKRNSDAHMLLGGPGKMLTELLNDAKYDKNVKKLIVCVLGSSDTVAVESTCRSNKLCYEVTPLVPLHGQQGPVYVTP